MATDFPTSKDELSNPAGTDAMSAHAEQHTNANDAIEALETKVGIDASADTNSHDYKIAQLESGKADSSHDHTASEVTDFDTEVANNSAVSANTAKNSYPSEDATKLSGIESAATADQAWGEIEGTLADQTDLQSALDAKSDDTHAHLIDEITDVTISPTLGKDDILVYGLGTWESKTLAGAGIAAATHTHAASAVTDFDTEVSNNTAVAANTAKNSYPSADATKLAGIEALADVTDTANVTAAGALMDSEVTNLAEVKAFSSADYAAALGADDNYVTDAEKANLHAPTVVGTKTVDETDIADGYALTYNATSGNIEYAEGGGGTTNMQFVVGETPTGTVNGTNTDFTLASTPATGSERVYLNGVRQDSGASNDYTISADTITFNSAPLTGDKLEVDYNLTTDASVDSSVIFINNETPSGTVNGTNDTFTTAETPISGSEMVYRDGQLLKGGGEDYTLSSSTITFTTAPVTGSVLLVSYRTANASAGDADTLDGQHASDIMSGWYTPTGTFTYSSVDDPTGVLTTSADLTGVISVGMRIKFTNASTNIYGIVTAITSSAITFLHEIDPTDSLALTLLANSAVSDFRYSPWKVPVGFPLDPRKWSMEATDVTIRSQVTTANTWYNLGTSSLSVPIGVWQLGYKVEVVVAGTAGYQVVFTTLSTANNSESDADYTVRSYAHSVLEVSDLHTVEKFVALASKTAYYLNLKTDSSSKTLYSGNNTTKAIIRATCAYL